MAYEPTELEKRASALRDRALQMINDAREALGEAEGLLNEEERKHRAPSPSNQRAACAYVEAANELDRVWETITGEPRVKVISSKVTRMKRIFRGEVIEDRRL